MITASLCSLYQHSPEPSYLELICALCTHQETKSLLSKLQTESPSSPYKHSLNHLCPQHRGPRIAFWETKILPSNLPPTRSSLVRARTAELTAVPPRWVVSDRRDSKTLLYKTHDHDFAQRQQKHTEGHIRVSEHVDVDVNSWSSQAGGPIITSHQERRRENK